ncbi:hypothetical protein Tco_0450758 [Tanacetum coccineum]
MVESPFNKFKEDKTRVMLPKRPRNAAWFKEKLMLAEAQEVSQILDEEQLAFLADLVVTDINKKNKNQAKTEHEMERA